MRKWWQKKKSAFGPSESVVCSSPMATQAHTLRRDPTVDPAAAARNRALASTSVLDRPRTRDVLHTVIRSSSLLNETRPDSTQQRTAASQRELAGTEEPSTVPSSSLFNKTWNFHKTTPFYDFNPLQHRTYAEELLTYIAANARNLTSSALAEQTQDGSLTFVNGNRLFPGQIDNAGRNITETLDDPGDIKKVEIQQLILDHEKDGEERTRSALGSIMITINVRPKGKSHEQTYHCAVLLDQQPGHNQSSNSAFANFNLVLIKSPVVIGQLVIQWLERRFDCRICRLLLQPYELRKIVDTSLDAMYNHVQGRDDRRTRAIELHYVFPESVDSLKSISISLLPEEARQLLVSREEGSNAGFLDGVEAHCSDSMQIDFGRLTLTRAGCSAWYLASEGKAKIFPLIADRHSLIDFIREIGKCGT
ncbi:kinetochore complex Sim4 subunit Fta1-domain-containing protein [Gamsiella multidivaricata]|uniref:kinetochore complex Sim4 subunit Fta1-domain-containing protein n=1 Tax=Gamsiella multidivaricata TaxID=101098 RepID=UPI00221F2E71|nr:kinetochore complex Sim4 subunit Fta1-domain-containing protein [Gamsiella multidivaricata]KAI7823623.1 kinetochore complex Sim4 subunit Fta1-domain-containing protein [Gamsiella multidivaricata]